MNNPRISKLIEKIKWKCYMRKNLDSSTCLSYKRPQKDLPSLLYGYVFVVTRANFGLGSTIIEDLEKKGARVYQLEHDYRCDMSDLKKIKAFCDDIRSKETKLDGIINLASCINPNYKTNELGIEKTFATNVVVPYLLFTYLYPLIEKSEDPRILVDLNPFFLNEKLEPTDMNFSSIKYVPWKVFIQCERRRVELWKHLANQYSNVRFYLLNPGFINSIDLKEKLPAFRKEHDYDLRLKTYGEYLAEWCATSKKVSAIPSGALIIDKKPAKEYIFEYNKTSQMEHQQFISNFKLFVKGTIN